jgi:catecholate siderophore receptor
MKASTSLFPLLLSGMALGAYAAPSTELRDGAQADPALNHLPTLKVSSKKQQQTHTALHTPTALKDTPQAVNVISDQVMKSQNATTLKDALKNVAGLTFSAGEGGAIGDSINLRGFSARTDVFVDGLRDRAQVSRDTAFIQNIEVLKGSSAMAFGRGGVGGVVNQSIKHAQVDSHREVGVSIGTEQYGRVAADINEQLADDVYGRVVAYGQQSDSTRDVVEHQKAGLLLSGLAKLSDQTKVTATVMLQKSDETPDYGVPFINGAPAKVSKANFYGLSSDKYEQETEQLILRVEHKINKELFFNNQLSYGHADINASPSPVAIAASQAGKPYADVVVTRQRRERTIDDENLFNQSELVWKVRDAMGWKHMVLAGVELGRETSDLVRYNWSGLPNVDLVHPNPNDSLAGATRTYASTASTTADSQSIYLQDQIKLNEQWQVLAGLRWDRFDATYTLNSATAGITELAQTDHMLSYRSGVVFTPQANASYYLSYGTAFNPSADTLTVSTANANLDPEESRTIELGAKWLLMKDRLSINSAIFDTTKTNMRTADRLDATVNSLDGEARVRGAELEVTGKISPTWQVLASYAYLDTKIVKSNNSSNGIYEQGHEISNTPKNSASLWSMVDLSRDWQVGGGVFYMGERYANNYGTLTVPSYTRLDATVTYRQPAYDLRLNLKNLSDETIYEEISGGRAVPAEGRTAQLSLSYRF